MTVVWDGRRSGPGGAHLVTEEHHRTIAIPPPTRPSATALVLQQLADRPMTVRELAATLKLDSGNVNGSLYFLRLKALVEVVRVERRGRCFAGRRNEQVYGLTDAGKRAVV